MKRVSSLVMFTMLFSLSYLHHAQAVSHDECQNGSFNTYQQADCERSFAQKELLNLNETVDELYKNSIDLGLSLQVTEAQKAFIDFVEKDCKLMGDATFGTMGTYVFEECRFTHFQKRRIEWLALSDMVVSYNKLRK